MIDQSLERLERSVFTAPASSDGEAKIRAEEGKMILEFTERARKIIPLGKVVIADQGQVANIRLEQGDIIHIPAKTDLIHIGGEVLMPQALRLHSMGGWLQRARQLRPNNGYTP